MLKIILLLLLAACGSESRQQGTTPPPGPGRAQADTAYTYKTSSRDGTGKFYFGREIAQVMGHLGAEWLERPEREQEERTDLLLNVLHLKPTNVVADIGAGTGYFTFRMAPTVPKGNVLAVDIQPEMLDFIRKGAKTNHVTNVEPVLGDIDNPHLPAQSVDVVLLVDAYHEFSHPREMLQHLATALKPGGRIVLVEYRGEDPAVPIKPLHKMTLAQADKEFKAAGLRRVHLNEDLPQQHVMEYQR